MSEEEERVTWVRIDDGFYSHPKVITTPVRSIGALLLLLSWSAHQKTDGMIPAYVPPRLGLDVEDMTDLVAHNWLTDDSDGWTIIDFADYNPTRAEQDERRKANTAGRASSREKARHTADAGFDEFWRLYPKKQNKLDAKSAYLKALQRTDHGTLLAGLRAHNEPWATFDPQYIPYAATWLNGDRWEDTPPSPRTAPSTKMTRTEQARATTEWFEAQSREVRAIGESPRGEV